MRFQICSRHLSSQRPIGLTAALAALALGFGSAATQASTLSPATYSYRYGGHQVSPTTPGTYTFSDGDVTGQVTFGLMPTPSILAIADHPDAGGYVVSGLMEYAYHIDGLAPGNTVSGTISTHQNPSGTPDRSDGFWENSTTLTAGNVSLIACSSSLSVGDVCNYQRYPTRLDETVADQFTADGTIDLSFNIHLELAGGRAFIDPVITLPPGYTITFSAGVGNSDLPLGPSPIPTPEPATLALLGTGLLGLVAARRRR